MEQALALVKRAEGLFPSEAGSARGHASSSSSTPRPSFVGGSTEFVGGELFDLPSWVAKDFTEHAAFASTNALAELHDIGTATPVPGTSYHKIRR